MRRFEFPEGMLEIISRERFHHPDPNVQRGMEVLWLKAHGETHEQIATVSGGSHRTVQRILDLFRARRVRGRCGNSIGISQGAPWPPIVRGSKREVSRASTAHRSGGRRAD